MSRSMRVRRGRLPGWKTNCPSRSPSTRKSAFSPVTCACRGCPAQPCAQVASTTRPAASQSSPVCAPASTRSSPVRWFCAKTCKRSKSATCPSSPSSSGCLGGSRRARITSCTRAATSSA